MIVRLVAECAHGHRLADMALEPNQLMALPVVEERQEGNATVTFYGKPNVGLGPRLQFMMHPFSALGRILERHGCPACQRGKQLPLDLKDGRVL